MKRAAGFSSRWSNGKFFLCMGSVDRNRQNLREALSANRSDEDTAANSGVPLGAAPNRSVDKSLRHLLKRIRREINLK
ncbi:hypothetical protein [Paraburkholderia sp. IW21]|uniref:hypothetical protein n=1 Tax=Paraburkholderia sp. IW21 TaxID=3242488 RepID=UPI0035220574